MDFVADYRPVKSFEAGFMAGLPFTCDDTSDVRPPARRLLFKPASSSANSTLHASVPCLASALRSSPLAHGA
eukprot:2185003-Rhodomonas_salina.1